MPKTGVPLSLALVHRADARACAAFLLACLQGVGALAARRLGAPIPTNTRHPCNGIMEKAMVKVAALEAEGRVREAAEVMAAAMVAMAEEQQPTTEQQLGLQRFTEQTPL